MKKHRGKHMKKEKPKYFRNLLIILLLTTITGTVAYLMFTDNTINEFSIGEVEPEIIETFNAVSGEKTDVSINNNGNIPIYVRATITTKWKDNDGKILETPPQKDTDYTISFSNSENWIKSDEGFYYYKIPLDVNENTDILIEECTQINNYNDRSLEVSVIAQGIQAEPSKAVREAWNVYVINNCVYLEEE